MNYKSFIPVVVTVCLINACGENSSDESNETRQRPQNLSSFNNQAYLIDYIVAGIDYQLIPSGARGVSNENGVILYTDRDTEVVFSINGLKFPAVALQEKITPVDIFPNNNDAVTNALRFLQSIDNDGDPDNGITINNELVQSINSNTINFDQSITEFEQSVASASNVTLIPEEQARNHFERSKERIGSSDPDRDGIEVGDICPLIANSDQLDSNGDGLGDVCDPQILALEIVTSDGSELPDNDGDGIPDEVDESPNEPKNPPKDEDGNLSDDSENNADGAQGSETQPGNENTGENTDEIQTENESAEGSVQAERPSSPPPTDSDNDGTPDNSDAFPNDPSETSDSDNDGIGNNADNDDDNDGYTDEDELANGTSPTNPSDRPSDNDGDDVSDLRDDDDDNDNVKDADDAYPFDKNESIDTDGDGIGNNADTDDDGDGYTDEDELANETDPLDANSVPADNDGDKVSDLRDEDDDNDAVNDDEDAFPFDETRQLPTVSGRLFINEIEYQDADINDSFVELGTEDQLISNNSIVNGFISNIGTNDFFGENSGSLGGGPNFERFYDTFDDFDQYTAFLQQGQEVRLYTNDIEPGENIYNGDADLAVCELDENNEVIQGSCEVSFETAEFLDSIQIERNGKYLIAAFPFTEENNITKYRLEVGVPDNGGLSTASSSNSNTTSSFSTSDLIPYEIIVRITDLDQFEVPAGWFADKLSTEYPVLLRRLLPGVIDDVVADTSDISSVVSQVITAPVRETLKAIKNLITQPGVKYAEPNYHIQALSTSDDPLSQFQWHYNNINLPAAWNLLDGVQVFDVVVAVLDSGVVLNHDDLSSNLIAGYDFVSDPNNGDSGGIDSDPSDPGDIFNPRYSWHGTHVTGTIAAIKDNQIGLSGVGVNNLKVMPVRVLSETGGNVNDFIQGLRYSAGLPNNSGTVPDAPADIINMSLGGAISGQAEFEAITEARRNGVILIAAAGNNRTEGNPIFYPASYDGVISVAATTIEDQIAPYSNFNSFVDIAAPGGDARRDSNNDGIEDGVFSTVGRFEDGQIVSDFNVSQGTSMASPHVAGVVGLMKSIYPELTPDDLDMLITTSNEEFQVTNDLGPDGRDDDFGYGLINARKAVVVANILAGGSSPKTVILESNRTFINLLNEDKGQFILSNTGNRDLTSVEVIKSPTWLTATPVNSFAGEWLLQVNREGLVDGNYSGSLVLRPNDGGDLSIAIRMNVGDTPDNTFNFEVSFIGLINVDESANQDPIITFANPDGSYIFDEVPAGEYELVSSSDIDVNNILFELGEYVGIYPSFIEPETIIVESKNLEDLDMQIDSF